MKKYLFLFFCLISIIACSDSSDNDEMGPSLPSIHSGSVYFGCEYGPYLFSLDSLLENCSTNDESLLALLTTDNLTLQDSSLVRCSYDLEAAQLADQENWDLKVSRTTGGTSFELEWQEMPNSIEAQTATVGGTNLADGEYPFYNGYTVQISEDKTMSLLFFNVYIGGCYHDLMVWELVNGE